MCEGAREGFEGARAPTGEHVLVARERAPAIAKLGEPDAGGDLFAIEARELEPPIGRRLFRSDPLLERRAVEIDRGDIDELVAAELDVCEDDPPSFAQHLRDRAARRL